jgi:hypothetical protein
MAQGKSLTARGTVPKIDRTEDSVRPSARTMILAQQLIHSFSLVPQR